MTGTAKTIQFIQRAGRKAMMLMLALGVMCAISGCTVSYKLNGSALNYDIYKTVSMSEFPIRAALVYSPLQQTFENKLRDQIQSQTRLSMRDNPNTDLRLEGEITGYTLTPQAVNDNAYASQTRLTITVRVKYIDNKNDKNSTDQSFSAYHDFSSDLLLSDVQDQECETICEDLCTQIFNATFGNW